jgi:hypothetical protein
MRLELTRHPDFPCDAVDAIAVEVARDGGALSLRYEVRGRPEALAIPPPSAPDRADELWRHTCFEAFVQPQPGAAYLELNLAPSGAWAAYAFDSYRAGMRNAKGVMTAGSTLLFGRGSLMLATTLIGLPEDAPLRVGLSAVIEEAGGRISYWALKHPAGRPDFHSPDCLALDLPAPLAP